MTLDLTKAQVPQKGADYKRYETVKLKNTQEIVAGKVS